MQNQESTSPPPPVTTRFTKLLGIDYPIIAAPMFLVSDVTLTSTVCLAGATAAFPALNFRSMAELRNAIQVIKKTTAKPFGVNIIVQENNKLRDQQIDICLEEGIGFFISSLGDPTALINKAHAQGIKVFCDVVGEKHARKAIEAGADGLVAVASGAGGHAGNLSAFALVPLLRKIFSGPIVAAGAIVNGQTMLAALALGADAVYMGTRFIASREAAVTDNYKQAIVAATADDILNTDRVDGFPGNFIQTKELAAYVSNPSLFERVVRLFPKFEKTWSLYKASKSLLADPKKVKASYKTVFSAGHGVSMIGSIGAAKDIVTLTVKEYWQAKKNLP